MPYIFKREDDYNNIIDRVSKETNVPAYLIKAFVAVESGFNKNAVRKEPHRNDASYGLIQILKKTAENYGFKGSEKDLQDPYTNLKYGAYFIKTLMNSYSNLKDVIASYNAGFPRKANNTTNIIKSIYGEPKPDWIYANQPYVDKVFAYTMYFMAKQNNDFKKAYDIRSMILSKNYDKISGNINYLLIAGVLAFIVGLVFLRRQ